MEEKELYELRRDAFEAGWLAAQRIDWERELITSKEEKALLQNCWYDYCQERNLKQL